MKVTFTNDTGATFADLRVGEAFFIPTNAARYIKSTVTRAIRFTKDLPPCNVGIGGNVEVQPLPDTEVIFK